MFEDRARQIVAAAVLGVAAVVGGYLLSGVAVAALVALAAYAIAVFVLGLSNAGAVAAAVVTAVAVVAVVDASSDEAPVPPERAALREARSDLRRLVRDQGQARKTETDLRDEGKRLQRKLTGAERRATRLQARVRKLSRRGGGRRTGG